MSNPQLIKRRSKVKHAQKIPTPTEASIKQYIKQWKTLENYTLQERSLNKLFKKLCPRNRSIEDILLKVSTLNDFYSTNIFKTYSVAKHILGLNVDKRLANGDPELVNDIARIKIAKRTINFYSFASKFCNHHNSNSYPIYDSFVEKMLLYFKKQDKYDTFKKADLKSYKEFMRIIKSFQKFYKLHKCSLREIDIFLWLAGKKYFPKKYY